MFKKKIKAIRYLSRILFLVVIVATAGLVQFHISLGLLILAIVSGASFCGWLCPFGLLQDIGGEIGKKLLKKRYRLPVKYQKFFQYFRYSLFTLPSLGLGIVFIYDPQISLLSLLSNIYVSIGAWMVLIIFVILSIFIDRPFCNYFCIEGSRISLQGILRIFRIKRDKNTCISCGACDRVCPMNIEISNKKQVNSINCINCFECLELCPKKSLSFGLLKLKNLFSNK